MKKKTLLISLLCAVVAGGGVLFWSGVPQKAFGQQNQAQAATTCARPVPTAEIQPAPDANLREFPATVQAARRVDLSFSVSGVLIELHGKAGSVVTKGEVIARLDPRDYQNALDSAQARYDEARQNLMRTRTLRSQSVTTESELDSAEATYETSEAELRTRRKALEDTVMVAPFNGVVARRYVENHEHIQENTEVLSLQSIDNIEVSFQVPERLVAQWGNVALDTVQVRFEADAHTWREAKVREVSAEADAVTRTYEVVAGVDAPEKLKMLSGMTAVARLLLPAGSSKDVAVLAPMTAVFGGSDGESYVWVIDDNQAPPVKTRVELGGMRDEGVEILSGLEPGQRVAVAGVHSLSEEMVVRPMRAGSEGLE